ncbi:MAG: outer-membrane lipoprotein carrier protein LolA [Ignavibacteria bacterium]|jgi:outer membrane lipoprotein-sorting protein
MLKFIAALLILAGSLFPQTADIKIKELQDKFQSFKDFQADFKQVSDNPNFNISQSLSGTFYYKNGNKFLIDLSNIKIVSNGNTIWNYDGRQNRTVINNLSDNPDITSLEKIVFDYPEKCEISVDDDKPENIIFVPCSNELNFDRAVISLNKENLISKIKIIDISKAEIIFEFSNYKLNGNIPDKFFEFNIPGDSKVIDFR